MTALRYLTAGESHGPALTAIVEGYPAGVPLSASFINRHLARRQSGFGRGARMAIEADTCRFQSGVRHGFTLGSPIAVSIQNRDWGNWGSTMSPEASEAGSSDPSKRVRRPRPGHADLVGAMKYHHHDLRNVLERASARETAARVAVGAVALALLRELGVTIGSHVTCIGPVLSADTSGCSAALATLGADAYAADKSPVRCLDARAESLMVSAIEAARVQGDSLGGVIEVVAFGLPPGLGSYVHGDRRLDARLAGAVVGIQAIKGVEFGLGFASARLPGSQVHDAIGYTSGPGFSRASNNAGGLEGGMSTGQPLVLRAAMKPIPTLYRPLESIDLDTMLPYSASVERSDVCAVPAAAVVCEAMVAWVLAEALLEKLGGDYLAEIAGRADALRRTCADGGVGL